MRTGKMDLNNYGKWKKSKVESFIRRHLISFDLGMTRYYEMCMWDNKGTLSPSYAILMDNSVVLTENPPKNIIQRIPLGTIQDISLIADRHSLIRGKNNNSYICQHISITFESAKNKKSKLEANKHVGKSDGVNINQENRTGESRSTSSLFLNDDSDDLESHHSQMYQSIASSLYSEVCPSPAPSLSLNESFGSSFLLSAYQQQNPTKRGRNINSWINSSENNLKRNESDMYLIKKGNNNNENIQLAGRKNSLMKELNYEMRGGSSPTSHATSPDLWQPHLRKKEKYLNVSSHPNKINTIQRGANAFEESKDRSTEGVINRRKANRTPEVDELEKEQENLTNKKKKGVAETQSHQQRKKQQMKAEKVQEVHLYFYQRDSEFLNEISLLWNRQQLKNTEQEDDHILNGISKAFEMNRSLRIAEKVVNQVAQDWHKIGDDIEDNLSLSHHALSKTSLLRKVGFLHKCLLRYENLKYLCWKNSVIMTGLINAVTICLEPISSHNLDKYSLSGIAEIYMDKLATYTILMEIFRTLFEACSVTWFKESEFDARINDNGGDFIEAANDWEVDSWDYKLTAFKVTQKLMIFILKCPFLPQDCNAPQVHDHKSYLTLADSEKYAKAQWLALEGEDSTKLTGLISTAHNASVSLLFELLAMSHFLPKFVEQALVANGIQQMNVEHFVRLSVSQIVNILWSNNDPLNASQTMVLYRQVWNLRTLIKHDRKILNFIRQNYSEEFQYYIQSKGIKARIPDKYTIKSKVIDACEKLCEDIVRKSRN